MSDDSEDVYVVSLSGERGKGPWAGVNGQVERLRFATRYRGWRVAEADCRLRGGECRPFKLGKRRPIGSLGRSDAESVRAAEVATCERRVLAAAETFRAVPHDVDAGREFISAVDNLRRARGEAGK